MKCAGCDTENADGVKFCGRCGIRLMEAPTSILERPHDADESVAEPAADDTPSVYRVIRRIGSGGIGEVDLAWDERLGRYVAVKRLGRGFADSPWMKARFSREAKSIAALNHRHIVQVYAYGEDDTGPFIVMEYVRGPGDATEGELPPAALNLDQKVHRDGPLSPQGVVELLSKLCQAISYAHRQGIVHRDLKPSNILIDESAEPKIADFGLARRAGGDDIRLTGSGERILSLGYGAPEQETDAGSADERADIYALGGILFYCLTGDSPRYFREEPIPPALRPSILKAMARDRADRWESAEDFRQALLGAANVASSATPTTTTGLWRCKWCHTINPLVVRYCSECGWDGMDPCPECDAELRVGIRYCGTCGADVKAFEEAEQLVGRLENLFERKEFAEVVAQANGIQGFKAKDEGGRKLLERAERQRKRSEEALQRKNYLRKQISHAQKRGNLPRLETLIAEFDELDATDAYAEFKVGLPARVRSWRIEDALRKARDAWHQGDMPGAGRFCREILEQWDAQHAEAERLLGRVLRRKYLRHAATFLAAATALSLLYVFSVCPATALLGENRSPRADAVLRRIYAPSLWLYRNSLLRGPLKKCTRLLGGNLDGLALPAESSGTVSTRSHAPARSSR